MITNGRVFRQNKFLFFLALRKTDSLACNVILILLLSICGVFPQMKIQRVIMAIVEHQVQKTKERNAKVSVLSSYALLKIICYSHCIIN